MPSDFEVAYRGLEVVHAANLATGHRFLEWGSGIGVVACLATYLGFDAIGIEIESPLAVEELVEVPPDHGARQRVLDRRRIRRLLLDDLR